MSSIEDLQKMTLADGDEISHDDVTDRIPEVWGAEIEKAAEAVRVFRNFVTVNTDLVGKPGSVIKLPKRAYIDYTTYSAQDIANDLTDVPINTELTFDTVTIEPTEVGMATSVTKQAIDEVMISMLDNLKMQLAEGIATKEDQDIVAAITAASDTDPITVLEADASSTTYATADYDVAYAGADIAGVATTDVLDMPLIAEGMVTMQEAGFKADTLFVHPRQTASLLKDDMFIDASKAGATQFRENGVITRLYGIDIVESLHVPSVGIGTAEAGYMALLIDKSAAAALAVKRPVTIETEYKPQQRKHYIYATTMYKAARLNSGAIVGLVTGVGA
jgi:N4-gp56 family major capsid protein